MIIFSAVTPSQLRPVAMHARAEYAINTTYDVFRVVMHDNPGALSPAWLLKAGGSAPLGLNVPN